MRRFGILLALVALGFGLAAVPRHLASQAALSPDFVHFESSHVHPLAMTPSGSRLLVVNTADNRLSVFDLTGSEPLRVAEVPVGLEPVSVAALSDGEAWVVNHLSDDVSVVDLTTMHVRATLAVGDEPCDVVFAGAAQPGVPFAYVSVAEEDMVKVYDSKTLAQAAAIPIDGRKPRALARNPNGSLVYVAVFHAGNRTSVLSQQEVTLSTNPPTSAAPPPNPPLKQGLPPPPITGLIVQQQGSQWVDEAGQVWNTNQNPTGQAKISYTAFDTDVAEIATATNSVTRIFGDIATVNLGLAVSAGGTVAVTGTEARNLRRFEPNLRGHMVDTRAALITAGGTVTRIDLNPTLDFGTTPGPASDLDVALGLPIGAAWSGDSQHLYVTALADNRIARIDVAGSPTIGARAPTVAGPSAVTVDDARGRIYVVGRFRNQLETLRASDLAPLATARIGMDPTPDAIVNGRKFFYGGFTSGHGEEACATCHLFGDFDNIAWDLGNPQGDMQPIDTGGQVDPLIDSQVHPMKGPMTTQSLRGLPNTGMFHWRADRRNLDAFNAAFVNLMGRAAQLPDSEMAAFDDFVLPLVYPPNPNRFLDRSLRDAPLHQPSAARGETFFFGRPTDGLLTCNQCHASAAFGTGTNGQIIDNQALAESQDMKVPQLRNLYQKTGFTDRPGATNKRGFGFTHDGAVDDLFDFLHFPGFNFTRPDSQTADENRRDVEAFLLAFDTGMAPAVGAQVTFSGPNDAAPAAVARLDTLKDQAGRGFCELIAKGRIGGIPRGWWYQGADQWKPDKDGEPLVLSADLRALSGPGSEVTVTGVPVGSGKRMGIDRDRDQALDADELAAGSDPGDPASTPANVGVAGAGGRFGFRAAWPNPFRVGIQVEFALEREGRVDCAIFDLLGREVKSLARAQRFAAGRQWLAWDGRDARGRRVRAGVYFMRLETPAGRWTRAVVRAW
ncbi:MAG: hypothetical protein E6K78_07945 [Candidatus Eisenbacteria bacterium]|uniref:Cytochrome c domain-containing protein n=1 Tax=Eiseniibacteriota bacterium TaxID=2212470 RepID=A0A538TNZ8_UNCEI|nr:MAG: hypothetical protein E6K78_07945 [Candidatus Eisenbacteria bacterium]